MAFFAKQAKWLYDEFGIASVYRTGPDVWLIILARCLRMLAYGAVSLIIALFFSALEFSDFYIGLFMTLTLAGDVILSSLLTLVADKVGRRRILLLGSVLMALSGAVFALFENFWILLFAAVVGVISSSGGDFGPFRAIEESTLSHLTTPKTRSDVLAWYVTIASVGSAIGTLAAGRMVESLQYLDGWTLVEAYHAIFWVYVAAGFINVVFMLLLSANCEAENVTEKEETEEAEELLDERTSNDDEDDVDDGDDVQSQATATPESQTAEKSSMFSQISRETLSVMYKLWFLLIVDSLADGMVGYSLTNYYLDLKFHLAKSTLGDIMSISYVLSSCSSIFAGPLSRHLGLINTMVFTHLPSSVGVLLFPLPGNLPMTVALFFLRTTLNNMDQAPRSAFIAAVVKPEERTAVMGITGMLRTLAATAGPTVTGILAGHDRFWIAFVAAGALRIAYDLGLFALFVNMKLHKFETNDEISEQAAKTREPNYDEEELRDLQSPSTLTPSRS
jgi:MFS family permease